MVVILELPPLIAQNENGRFIGWVFMVLWKRLNTESDPKKRKPPQINFFEGFAVFFKNYRKSLKSTF